MALDAGSDTVLTIEADTAVSTVSLPEVVDVQKYNRSIHVMAMLLVGFGFLMVFVKKYGLSAVTATYLLVSTAIPLYMLIKSWGIFGEAGEIDIDKLILAEFAAAALLICAGAVLGRLKMMQYIILGVLFIPCYMLNEWLVLETFVKGFVDTGGSIVIHAFGAFFGLGVLLTMTTKKELDTEIESDMTSDRFSLLGSMVLWVFWPSFCGAIVEPALVPKTAINVILALSGSTLATYFVSVGLRRKICIADIANAALAGGVAIGSTCDIASPTVAFVIGVLAGAVSVFGFAVIQEKLQAKIKGIDTCGVMYLHGLPGLLGGVAAMFVCKGIMPVQLKGIGISIVVAVVAGFIAGKLLSIFGRRTEPYVDAEEIE
ncbi:MAG TPA: ammonium transporter [Phycisphaerales bacterium]|nr:ammonium transporter [Phycisphaerales bacterium]